MRGLAAQRVRLAASMKDEYMGLIQGRSSGFSLKQRWCGKGQYTLASFALFAGR